jgi:hypothetical protein
MTYISQSGGKNKVHRYVVDEREVSRAFSGWMKWLVMIVYLYLTIPALPAGTVNAEFKGLLSLLYIHYLSHLS